MYKKLDCCKFCLFSFDGISGSNRANHTRWCDLNPKKQQYLDKFNTIRKVLISSDSRLKQGESLKLAHKNGKFIDSAKKAIKTRIANGNNFHTEESKKKISEAALKSNHRRLLRSTRDYICKDGNVVLLDSSWEEALAKRLDELCVEWIRPKEPIFYELDGKVKRYFPDFYLPEYDLFLDPKNPYALKVQKQKIEIVLQKMKNLRLILTIEECKNFEI